MDNPVDTSNMLKLYVQAYMKDSTQQENAMISELGYWNSNFLAGASSASKTKIKEFTRFLKNNILDNNVALGYKIWGKQEAIVDTVTS